MNRVLVIGYGNPARGDDGVGPALVARLEEMGLADVTFESDYQLSIEHAQLAAEHGIVIFADAAADTVDDFCFRTVAERPLDNFTSHGVTAGQVLYLARSCFGASPEAYSLGIRAHVLDRYIDGLSAESETALEAAASWLHRFIESRRPPEIGTVEAGSEGGAISFGDATPGAMSRENQDGTR